MRKNNAITLDFFVAPPKRMDVLSAPEVGSAEAIQGRGSTAGASTDIIYPVLGHHRHRARSNQRAVARQAKRKLSDVKETPTRELAKRRCGEEPFVR